MGRAKALRNLAFVGLLVTAVAATETRLLAFSWSAVDQLCVYYDAEYDCGCSSNHFGTLSWTGSCDFSQEEDPLELASDYCWATFDACASDCEGDDFKDWLVDQNCWWFDPYDPACYAYCYDTWAAGNSCEIGGGEPDFGCTCAWLNVCM